MGHGMRHESRSGRLQSLCLFVESIPKDISNSGSYECLSSLLNPGSSLWEDPDGNVGFVHHRRTPGVQGRILIFQGTVAPFNLDTGLLEDQTSSISNLVKRLRG